jgi:uncharacterized GH25 family protein
MTRRARGLRCGLPLPALAGCLGAFVLAGLGAPARAHEYWLAPSGYAAAAHHVVEVGALAGTGFRGERKPWSALRCVRFVARARGKVDLAKASRNGDLAWARFEPTDDGGALIAYESDFARIELPADQFEAYLALEGLDGPLAARRARHVTGPGRERYRRCAKTWLSGSADARALGAVGLPLELVPLSVPGTQARLSIRLLDHGRPLEHALVKAWRSPPDPGGLPRDPEKRDSVAVASQGRTDARGEVELPVDEPGEWLVSAVNMVPSADPAAADWESTWASLTFVRPPARRTPP